MKFNNLNQQSSVQDEPDADLIEVEICGRRYDEILKKVLHLYEIADVHFFPLPVFDVAGALGIDVYTYRQFENGIYDFCIKNSEDAFLYTADKVGKTVLFYNDRKPKPRVNFSIMHEIGHHCLEHIEPSALAEKEANAFAATALCPYELVLHYGMTKPEQISKAFMISNVMAKYRLKRAIKHRNNPHVSPFSRYFCETIKNSIHLNVAFQPELFPEWASVQ